MDIVNDRRGNKIYITDERWEHICKRHPEVIGYEEYVLKTLRSRRRKQQRVYAIFRGEKLVGWVDFENITNYYMIGIEIHPTNTQNQPNRRRHVVQSLARS